MKVIIFYAKYGGGHLSAARSIESCISENYKNIDVELIDFMEYANRELNKITTKAYSEMAKKAPKTWGHLYWESQKGPLAHISTTSNKLLSIKINKLLEEKKPDLIISSGAAVAVPFFYLGKLFGAKTIYIEVFDRMDKPTVTGRLVYPVTDKFIVQWEEMKKVYPKAINLGSIF